MIASRKQKRQRKKLRYIKVSLILVVAIAFFGWLLNSWMTKSVNMPPSVNSFEPTGQGKLDQLFSAAVRHMQRGDYEQAISIWHQVLLINPEIPEVKVNMGFSLYEAGLYSTARDFFISAMEQDAYQANAYYGLAITSEKMGDLEGAMGAMRSYIHLAGSEEDERFVRRARSALWEWEAQLSSQSAAQSPAPAPPQPVDQK